MKHSHLSAISTAIFFMVSFLAHAEWYNEYTFNVGWDVCGPITVKYNGKSYTVYSSYTITFTGSTSTPSATDCNGKPLKYEVSQSSHRRGSDTYHYNTYTFYNRDKYTINNSNGNRSDNNGYQSGYNESAYQAGRALGTALFSLGGGADGDAYPSLQLAPVISHAYGEYLKIKYTGYGFHAYGGIGKDMLSNSEFKNRILWNVGIGSYFAFGGNGDPNMDVSIGLSVGQQAQWEKLSLMIDADYTYWIGRWRRIGLIAGGGLGWGSFTEMFNTDDYSSSGGFAWNIEAGIVIRLANF